MKNKFLITMAVLASFAACKPKDDEPIPVQTKTTYDFTNVNYSESDTLLKRYTDLSTETNKATTATANPTLLIDIYKNNNNKYPESFSLYGKTIPSTQTMVIEYLDSIGVYQTTNTAANGIAGVVTTMDNKKYFVDSKGFEYRQLMAKVLMGSLWYNQIKTLLNNDTNLDNTVVVAGQGTAMEHNWDLAFGLFGVPKDFPTNKTGLKNLGAYADEVNSMTGSSATLMNAFISGRIAISNKDMVSKNVQREIIINELERMLAASVIVELNDVKANNGDVAKVLHYASEGYGFVLALEEIGATKLSSTDFSTIYTYFGSNLYDLTIPNVDLIINLLKQKYNIQ